MKSNSNFITVEGLDGSGKSTICNYMSEYLALERNLRAIPVEAYPRDKESMVLRELWIQQKLPPIATLTMILELRARVFHQQIVPALLDGYIVISDRWHDTTWAYQYHAMGISHRVMSAVYHEMFNLHEMVKRYGMVDGPWIYEQVHRYSTIHLDVSLETSRQRVGGRHAAKDAFEKSGDDFFLRLKNGYNQHYGDRHFVRNPLHLIDANGDLEGVKSAVRVVLNRHVPSIPPSE